MGEDDSGAFERLARAYAGELGRLAYQLTGHREDARELAQDALLDAYRHRDRLAAATHPRAYLRRILVNRHLNNRRRRRVEEVGFDAGVAVAVVDPEGTYIDQDLLWQALTTLSDRQRTALVLRYYLGLDDVQAAALMSCRPPTVRSLVSRALHALRQHPALLEERGARP